VHEFDRQGNTAAFHRPCPGPAQNLIPAHPGQPRTHGLTVAGIGADGLPYLIRRSGTPTRSATVPQAEPAIDSRTGPIVRSDYGTTKLGVDDAVTCSADRSAYGPGKAAGGPRSTSG
jgi:hypothetical protein